MIGNVDNKFNLTESISEGLSSELAEKVRLYKYKENVEAIYINSYKNNSETAIVDLVVISDGDLNIKQVPYSKIYFGDSKVKVNIYSENAKDYNIKMKSSREREACVDLFNGAILFDRDGKYTKLKNDIYKMFDERNLVKSRTFSNNIEFDPPLVLVKKVV